MYSNDLLYQIALTLVPNIGDVHAKSLINLYGNAKDIFSAPAKDLEKIDGIGTVRANCIKAFSDFSRCETEILFLERYNIRALFMTDQAYPKRLHNCYDSPVLLYYRGNAPLNHSKIISIVGTRNNSHYGKWLTEKLVEDLAAENIIVISGLAYGIDTIAHQAALKNNIPTVGVLNMIRRKILTRCFFSKRCIFLMLQ